jgi:hypothetical protein
VLRHRGPFPNVLFHNFKREKGAEEGAIAKIKNRFMLFLVSFDAGWLGGLTLNSN